jgi:hypothetical protein
MSERSQPRPGPDVVEDGIPATEEVRNEILQTDDPAGVGDMPMGDDPWGSTDWGTTDREQREGEPLGVRLDRETPDVQETAGAGVRVYETGAEGLTDVEPDAVAELDTFAYDTLSPEEAAMTVREDPGGLTYDDPGYLDDFEQG